MEAGPAKPDDNRWRPPSPLNRAAVRATMAPSVHNTQPWRLAIGSSTLQIWADFVRRVHVFDPAGRQLMMSCGAALLNARVALAAADEGVVVRRFPSLHRPALVAELELAPMKTCDPQLAMLDTAVPARRTNRCPFVDQAVRPALIDVLVAAAEAEGAELIQVHTAAQRETVQALALAASAHHDADPGYRVELHAWRAGDDALGDGLPAAAFGSSTRPTTEGPEAWLVLTTLSDTEQDWLCAGEALERVLLTATRLGLAVGLIASVIEVPRTRVALCHELGLEHYPQLVLRVGWAEPSQPTRRRLLREVITESG